MNTKTAETNAKISARIIALRAAGLSTRDAVDAVLGAGTYSKIAGEVYDTLRARAGVSA
jgi:hypothetical protein